MAFSEIKLKPVSISRYFLLEKNAIGFGTGDGKVDWYEITRVDKTLRRNKNLFTIEYKRGEGTVFQRSLYYDSGNGGKIRFENQVNIDWVLVNSPVRSQPRHDKK